MNSCKYELRFPNLQFDKQTHCGAYSKSQRKDGFHWAHYPECKPENCPLLHPELLGDAILKKEE